MSLSRFVLAACCAGLSALPVGATESADEAVEHFLNDCLSNVETQNLRSEGAKHINHAFLKYWSNEADDRMPCQVIMLGDGPFDLSDDKRAEEMAKRKQHAAVLFDRAPAIVDELGERGYAPCFDTTTDEQIKKVLRKTLDGGGAVASYLKIHPSELLVHFAALVMSAEDVRDNPCQQGMS